MAVVDKETLLAILDDISRKVKEDDTYEGTLRWTCMDDHLDPARQEFEVEAVYRVGNSSGQGGMRMFQATEASGFHYDRIAAQQGYAFLKEQSHD